MHLYISPYTSPVENAALEEQLYRGGVPCLLFYRNSPSVIIGRNQNPFREVNRPWCSQNGIPLLRRISGGGAVYHDLGNLNYSFVVPRKEYDPDATVGIVIDALHALGIPDARIEGQHGIFVNGVKVSGSAFALNSQAALLHGCLLVSTNLEMLRQALRQPPYEFTGGGVASVRSPVTNLESLVPELTPERLQEAIIDQAQKTLRLDFTVEAPPIPEEALKEKYSSRFWNIENTPAFKVVISGIQFTVSRGHWPV